MRRTRRDFLFESILGATVLLAGCSNSNRSSGDSSTPEGTNSGNERTTAKTAIQSTTAEISTQNTRTTSGTVGSSGTTSEETGSPARSSAATTDGITETNVPTGPTSGQSTDVNVTLQNGELTITEINPVQNNAVGPAVSHENIILKNISNRKINLTGYTVDYGEKKYTIIDSVATKLDPGDILKVTTGLGGETIAPAENETVAGFSKPVLSKNGGTITVSRPDGTVILKASY